MNALFVTPTAREAKALGRDALICGTGEAAARSVRDRLRDDRSPVLVVAGVCGALDPSLAPGDVILCRSIAAEGKPELHADRTMFELARARLRHSTLTFITARCVTVARPAASRAEKTSLWNDAGAAGADMETYHVAAEAEELGVPWIAARAVVDPARFALPAPLRDWRPDADGEILHELTRAPHHWPAMIRLALHMRRAARSLRVCSQELALAIGAHEASADDLIRPDPPPLLRARG